YLDKGYSQEEAEAEAGKWVAIPGTSEHQTGLAVDIVALSYQLLDRGQEDTAEQKWLMENSYKYGYILRYPTDKSDITGIYYEPWHYRYVGKDVAKELYESGLCLEEYLLAKD
ncbi:MAG: M15 family metallopeptidase, partial [Clostridia bacterium]|nr:M15 family metallopeptidase [Clostridia bacterium]